MLSQLLLLSHCILPPMGPRLAAGAPRAVLSAASISSNNPANNPAPLESSASRRGSGVPRGRAG